MARTKQTIRDKSTSAAQEDDEFDLFDFDCEGEEQPMDYDYHNNFEHRYRQMKYQCEPERRNKLFDPSEEFKRYLSKVLLIKNCFYCGQSATISNYKFCGIDRMDPSLGYIQSNIVPCCWSCNKGKGCLTAQQFLDYLHNFKTNKPLTLLDMSHTSTMMASLSLSSAAEDAGLCITTSSSSRPRAKRASAARQLLPQDVLESDDDRKPASEVIDLSYEEDATATTGPRNRMNPFILARREREERDEMWARQANDPDHQRAVKVSKVEMDRLFYEDDDDEYVPPRSGKSNRKSNR